MSSPALCSVLSFAEGVVTLSVVRSICEVLFSADIAGVVLAASRFLAVVPTSVCVTVAAVAWIRPCRVEAVLSSFGCTGSSCRSRSAPDARTMTAAAAAAVRRTHNGMTLCVVSATLSVSSEVSRRWLICSQRPSGASVSKSARRSCISCSQSSRRGVCGSSFIVMRRLRFCNVLSSLPAAPWRGAAARPRCSR